MTEFMFGALGAILILASFSAGFWAACYFNKRYVKAEPASPARELTPEEKERQDREIKENEEAFRQLMGYNRDTAYGLDTDSQLDDGRGDDV